MDEIARPNCTYVYVYGNFIRSLYACIIIITLDKGAIRLDSSELLLRDSFGKNRQSPLWTHIREILSFAISIEIFVPFICARI